MFKSFSPFTVAGVLQTMSEIDIAYARRGAKALIYFHDTSFPLGFFVKTAENYRWVSITNDMVPTECKRMRNCISISNDYVDQEGCYIFIDNARIPLKINAKKILQIYG